jgi:serine/threonine-protein kinase RsbW
MADPVSITCDATLDNIPSLMAFVDEASRALGLDEDTEFMVRLAAEEVIVNVVRHGYAEASGPITVSMDVADGTLTVTVADQAPVFDPADATAPDLDASVEDRAIGGLGWHLVYRVMDEVRHDALPGGGNRVALAKQLPDSS